MKSKTIIRSLLVVAGMTALWIVQAGSLEPPGPPAPTMKTLDEVEPRIALNASNTPGDADSVFKITQPGSYYLTGNLSGQSGKMGIEIATGDVTLDLMGFALIGVPGSLEGVSVTSAFVRNVTVSNGTVRDWGGSGVDTSAAANGRLNNLRAFANGSFGLRAGAISTVEASTAFQNGSVGIVVFNHSVISTSVSDSNGSNGFSLGGESVISHCTATDNSGDGIRVVNGRSTVTDCASIRNGIDGIHDLEGSTIVHNTVLLNGDDGIEIGFASLVLENVCHRNGQTTIDGAGIHAIPLVGSARNRVEGNNVTENDIGIRVESTPNVILKNSASGNSTPYDIVAGNDVGPIGTAATSTSPWANLRF